MNMVQIAEEISRKIGTKGAEGEVYITEGSEAQVEVNGGKVEKLSQSGSKGMGVRVIKDGKTGYAYTSDFSPESLEKTWHTALELAEVADRDNYRSLPKNQPALDENLEIYDPAIAALSMEEKVAFAAAVEKAAMESDKRIVMTDRCTWLDGISKVVLANSNGFIGSYEKSFAGSYVMAFGKDENDSSMGIGLGISTHIRDLDPKTIGEEAGRKAVQLLGGKPVPTQEAVVVLDPFVSAELIYYLSTALTADSMQRGRSFLQNQLGKDVASDMVTLLDNGLLPQGLGTAPFDDEGVPTNATRIFDEGVFQAVLYDHYTAQKDGKQSTGNSFRSSHRSAPSLSVTNFYLQPGHQSPEEIIAGVENGFYVLNTMNTGGINPVSGDYSVAAQGLWIENGKLTKPVNEVTLALPLKDLLMHIRAVGNDLRFVPFFGNIGAPTIRIDGMTIAGKG